MLRNNIMYILYMTQLFKTANSGTIAQYFTCYCIKIIAMPIHEQQEFQMWHSYSEWTILTSCLTLLHNYKLH